MSRTIWMLGLAALGATAGCKGFDRPCDKKALPKPDLPQYSIEEQERRGRAKYALPREDFRTGPGGMIDRPSPTGR